MSAVIATSLSHTPANYTKLLTDLKALDPQAFETLYLNMREALFAHAFSILKDELVAEDVVQDFFVDFWESRMFLKIQTDLVSYIIRVVKNRSYDAREKEGTRHKRHRESEYLKNADDGPEEDEMSRRNLGADVNMAIASLSKMQAKVFRMHYIEKLSYRRISETLGISPSTISTHMDRALKALREALKKSWIFFVVIFS